MIKELAQYIEDNSAFVIGTTLQVLSREQDAPDRCVVIQETAGGDTNFWQVDMEWLQIQIVARGMTKFNARDDARAIHAILHGAAEIEFGISPTIYRATITAVAPPQYIGQDEQRRYEYSTNYRVAYYDINGT